MVNAAQHPGPALWQGIMLILMVPLFLYLMRDTPMFLSKAERIKRDKQNRFATGAYVAIGFVLLIVILVTGAT